MTFNDPWLLELTNIAHSEFLENATRVKGMKDHRKELCSVRLEPSIIVIQQQVSTVPNFTYSRKVDNIAYYICNLSGITVRRVV